MKKCKECGELKPLEQFHVARKYKGKPIYQSYCKTCMVKRARIHRENNLEHYQNYRLSRYKKMKDELIEENIQYIKDNKDGYYYVYYLPEEHYVGVTDNVKYRMYNHKCAFNRHVDNVEIVYRHTCRKEAELVESKLHSMGYQG